MICELFKIQDIVVLVVRKFDSQDSTQREVLYLFMDVL